MNQNVISSVCTSFSNAKCLPQTVCSESGRETSIFPNSRFPVSNDKQLGSDYPNPSVLCPQVGQQSVLLTEESAGSFRF
jgi:hypothetical protein